MKIIDKVTGSGEIRKRIMKAVEAKIKNAEQAYEIEKQEIENNKRDVISQAHAKAYVDKERAADRLVSSIVG